MKNLTFLLVSLALVPQIALAAWWNPFSWRSPKRVIPAASMPVVATSSIIDTKEVSAPAVSPKKVITPKTQEKPTISSSTNIKLQVGLKVTEVNVKSATNTAQINWRTSKPTDSKAYFTTKDGTKRVFISPAGVSTLHYVDISGLEDDSIYEYEIVGVNGEESTNYRGSFKTLPAPAIKTFDVKADSMNGPLRIKLLDEDRNPVIQKTVILKTNYKDGLDFADQKLTSDATGEVILRRENPIKANIRVIISTPKYGEVGRAFDIISDSKGNISIFFHE